MASNGSTSEPDSDRHSVEFDFLPGIGCIPDDRMEEIKDRLVGYIEEAAITGRHVGPNPPDDITLVWTPTDANGARIDNDKVYDPVAGEWVENISTGDETEEPEESSALFQSKSIVVNANGERTIAFTLPFDTISYLVNIMPTSEPHTEFRWKEVSRTTSQIVIEFFGYDATESATVNVKIQAIHI